MPTWLWIQRKVWKLFGMRFSFLNGRTLNYRRYVDPKWDGKHHGITEQLRLEEVSGGHVAAPHCSGRDTYNRLPRTLSVWFLKISEEEQSVTSLGSPFKCSITCTVNICCIRVTCFPSGWSFGHWFMWVVGWISKFSSLDAVLFKRSTFSLSLTTAENVTENCWLSLGDQTRQCKMNSGAVCS